MLGLKLNHFSESGYLNLDLDHIYRMGIADSNSSEAGNKGHQDVSVFWNTLDSKVHGTNNGLSWVLWLISR